MLRVLILEDDLRIADALVAAIKPAGKYEAQHHILVADAIKSLSDTTFDVALVDLNLPDGLGLRLLEALQLTQPPTPAIVLTSMIDQAAVVDAIQAGANGYLVKDETADRVLEALDEVLDGQQPMSTAATRLMMGFIADTATRRKEPAIHFNLTKREVMILHLIEEGLTYQQIAERLFIANSTVQTHIKNLYSKLNARNKTQALHHAFGGTPQ